MTYKIVRSQKCQNIIRSIKSQTSLVLYQLVGDLHDTKKLTISFFCKVKSIYKKSK